MRDAWIEGDKHEWEVEVQCPCGLTVYCGHEDTRCECGRVWSYHIEAVLLSDPDSEASNG